MLFTAFILLLVRFAFCQEGGWCYHGENGTSRWPELFPMYCSEEYNNRQSPIDINNTTYDPPLVSLVFGGYEKTLNGSTITNNGHTIEIVPNSEEYYISGDGLPGMFVLENIHFHWGCWKYFWGCWGFLEPEGSEHSLDGEKFRAEMHLVHRNTKYGTMDEAVNQEDGVAVLAIFLSCPFSFFSWWSRQNLAISIITEALKEVQYADTMADFDLGVPLSSLLPSDECQCFYRYNGSLTTPECNPSVIWTICKQPIYSSEVDKFCRVYKTEEGEPEQYLENNYRPLQERNGRTIVSSQACNQ